MVYDDDKSVIMSFLYLFMILKNTVIIGISLLTNLEMTSTIKVQIHLYWTLIWLNQHELLELFNHSIRTLQRKIDIELYLKLYQ